MKFVNKSENFVTDAKKKTLSLFAILLKAAFSFLVAVGVPLIFFVFFLFKEPRSIEVINKYIDNGIRNAGFGYGYKYENTKISLESINLIYNINNLGVTFGDNFLLFPKINLKIRVLNLLRGRFIIEELNIGKLSSHINLNNSNFSEVHGSIFSSDYISKLLYKVIAYLHMDGNIIKSLRFDNSILYFSDDKNKTTDKFGLSGTIALSRGRKDIVELDADFRAKINDEPKITDISGKCNIFRDKNIVCRSNINNISFGSLHLANVSTEGEKFDSIVKNIAGLFDCEFTANFTNYVTLESSSFSVYSDAGSFDLKQFFGGKITYRDMSLQGGTRGWDTITIKNLKSKLLLSRNIDFSMSFEMHLRKHMKIDININNASVVDVKILWPVFLDDFEIRKWVIEHFKDGRIPQARARMNFNYVGNDFSLTEIESEILLKETKLDYDTDFPDISNIDAKAIFTINDMNIYINSANMAKTQIKDGKVYINFNDEQNLLGISAKTVGKAYEAMYFIDNGAREKIEKIVTTYVDGTAFLDVDVKIPINDNISLSDTFIEINGEVKNNSTFLLSDQSNFKLSILKKFNSNVFSSEFDLADSNIKFETIDFVKLSGQNLKIGLDIKVIESEKILLDNIVGTGSRLNLKGSGVVKNSLLDELHINNLSYGDNSFSVDYKLEENLRGKIHISGDNLNFNKEIHIDDLKKYLSGSPWGPNLILDEGEYSISFKNLLINREYTIKNVDVNASFTAGTIDYLNAKTQRSDSNFMSLDFSKVDEQKNSDYKYMFRVECSNFGKFLSELNITNNLVYGDLYLDGNIGKNDTISGSLRLKNKFSYITETAKHTNVKFFNYILNSSEVPSDIKNNLVNQNTISFARLQADFKLVGNSLWIDNFLLNSDEVLGMGVSGSGSVDIKSGKIHFAGFVIPLEKINMLFGINKIPLVNKLFFGKEQGGLLILGYKFTRDNFDSDYNFEILPSSAINPVSILPILIIFLLL
ncbi:MAG: DUF3971 domain-containing protein [Rickettsiales bacterium]|nr:DUF3971 domain-containing protein [Rickettsiales bacterium]